MKILALVSGGKDSCHAMHLATREGHEVVALANLLPGETDPDELDSYMFQTVGHQLVEAYAACMGVPLFRRRIQGTSAKQDMQYQETAGDEVEDLFMLISYAKEMMPQISAVCSGAIASDYQRLRVENVCSRLNLASLAYMWHQPQRQLLRDMIDSPVHAVLVKVAALGLDPARHLGRSLQEMQPLLSRLSAQFGCNVCGEGGEYESLVLDCPLFKHGRIVLDASEVVTVSGDSIAPVGYLRPTAFHVEAKAPAGEPGGALGAEGGLDAGLAALHVEGRGPEGGLLGAGDVRMMPPKWVPSRNLIRRSIEYPYQPGQYEVAVHIREGDEYIQICCRPTCLLPSDCTAEASACTALHDIMGAVRSQLSRLGLSLSRHALFVHLFLANMGHFTAVNNVYCRYFPAVDPPSRACVQVPLPVGCPILVDILLARHSCPHKRESGDGAAAAAPPPRSVLHVQSISSWAPSCIGPYSQANMYRGLVHMAGTIPLRPASMAVSDVADVDAQTLQAVANCQAVAVALGTSLLGAALGLTLYVAAAAGREGGERALKVVEALLEAGALPGEGAGEGEEGERGDGYLEPGRLTAPLRPTVSVVVVDALPRGCLVEVVPLLVDAAGWARRAREAAEAGSESGGEEEAAGRASASGAGGAEVHHGSAGAGAGSGTAEPGTAGPGAAVHGTAGCSSAGLEAPGAGSGSLHRRSGSQTTTMVLHACPSSPYTRTPGPGGPPPQHRGSDTGHSHNPGPGSGSTTHHSGAGPAPSATPAHVPGPMLLAAEAAAAFASTAAAAPSQTGPPPGRRSGDGPPPGRRSGDGPPSPRHPACASLVTTVCHMGCLLKSTFHLPLAVFLAEGGAGGPGSPRGAGGRISGGGVAVGAGPCCEALLCRLQRAVAAVLSSHGLRLGDVVSAIAWFDVNKVPAPCADGGWRAGRPQASGRQDFHISWVPAVEVFSSACSESCAAIMQVVAVAPS